MFAPEGVEADDRREPMRYRLSWRFVSGHVGWSWLRNSKTHTKPIVGLAPRWSEFRWAGKVPEGCWVPQPLSPHLLLALYVYAPSKGGSQLEIALVLTMAKESAEEHNGSHRQCPKLHQACHRPAMECVSGSSNFGQSVYKILLKITKHFGLWCHQAVAAEQGSVGGPIQL